MAHGVHPVIGLGDFGDVQSRLHHGGDAVLLQNIAHRQGVHGRGQHPHIIRAGAFDLAFAVFHAPPEVSAPHHEAHLGSRMNAFTDGLRHPVEGGKIQATMAVAGQGFPADL